MREELHPALRRLIGDIDRPDRAVIATDPAGRVVFWNDAAETLYGWSRGEAVGRNILELTPGELGPEAEEILKALTRGEPWSGEFIVQARDGSRFTAHVTDIPVTDETGELIGIVGISRRSAYLRQQRSGGTRT